MKCFIRTSISLIIAFVLILTSLSVSVFAEDSDNVVSETQEEMTLREDVRDTAFDAEEETEEANEEVSVSDETMEEMENESAADDETTIDEDSVIAVTEAFELADTAEDDMDPELPLLAAGDTVTGTFDSVDGYDIATIRYYTDQDMTEYAFAEFVQEGSTYTYSFAAPYDGFTQTQGTEYVRKEPVTGCTVIAEYYSLTRWDGAVDVSWYNESDSTFYIYDPAQFAGFAAIVNGSVDGRTEPYHVKGYRSDMTGKSNRGLPDFIESEYVMTDLAAQVKDYAYVGVARHDFSDRTVVLMSDLDMGGTDGSGISRASITSFTRNKVDFYENFYDGGVHNGVQYPDYPNWMPVSGLFLADPADYSTVVLSYFNGSFDGNGHNIDNIYSFRYSCYIDDTTTAYGYAQGTGLFGDVGELYDGESAPASSPSFRNFSLSGFFIGRRMVGGVIGLAYDECGSVRVENVANHSYIYGTDSKGLGGIVGSAYTSGSIINCYNTGYMWYGEYAAPAGGIVGSNEGMDIYCCYNTGTIDTGTNDRGRAIGSDYSGSNYTVDNCYYLKGSGDCVEYPGYYTYNLAKSVSVTVTEMEEDDMTNGSLLELLNINGIAYVTGPSGYPELLWETGNTGTGNLTVTQITGGTIYASQTGILANGTVIYLENDNDNGYKLRYFTDNGAQLSGDYVTVYGDSDIQGFFESVKPGALRLNPNAICDISITKNGTVYVDGVAQQVANYPVEVGDSLYEGDVLFVEASVREGMEPDDPDLQYSDLAGLNNPFIFTYTYMTGDDIAKEEFTEEISYTVGGEIGGDDATLILDVSPKTTYKLWKYTPDTSWYNEQDSSFILTNAKQLAGLEVLVNDGNDFADKTILLGNNISLANDDGTTGKRYWDGIGTINNQFAGTFDGQGYVITDISGTGMGLFAYAYGSSGTSPAVIKNVTIYGSVTGYNASGIVSYAKNAELSDCNAYCEIVSTGGRTGGIAGYAQAGVTINDCMNYGCITRSTAALSDVNIGGICGQLDASSMIVNCINKGNITAESTGGNYVGGVAGSLSGMLNACANYGVVRAWGRSIGGVAGASLSKLALIRNCYNAGDVAYENGTNTYDCVGGIIGFGSFYVIQNSFNWGSVTNEAGKKTLYIGAIIGREGKKSTSSTSNVYTLDTANADGFIDNGTVFEDLAEASYTEGMKVGTRDEFADPDIVLAGINEDGKFVLVNGEYPELSSAAAAHTHTGGVATCSSLAVCGECGMHYGKYDPDNHVSTEVVGITSPVWTTNGYTGDTVCKACGEVLKEGTWIQANTLLPALTVYTRTGSDSAGNEVEKIYTIADLDALKSSGTVGFQFGGQSKEQMAAVQYVTIESIVEDLGLTLDGVKEIYVKCSSSYDKIDAETFNTCKYYFYEDGTSMEVPFCLAIRFCTGTADLESLSTQCVTPGYLRVAYGLSKTQYEQGAGGRRLASPVESLVVVYEEHEHVYTDPEGVCQHKCSICGKAEESTATCTESGFYECGSEAAASGHNYVDGHCTICGDIEGQLIYDEDTDTWYYYHDDEIDMDKYGFVQYEGGKFLIANGRVATEVCGLFMDPDNNALWYYLADGQVVNWYTGLVEYDGAWFYVENGIMDTAKTGYVEYDGGLFFVAVGRIIREANGLAQDPENPDTWYYLANGEVQVKYTGLAFYDGEWFYVENGKFIENFTGEVEYDGAVFMVVNGMVVS